MTFTQEQQETIDVRGSSVLVSAAAGSGKTAVLVERIIRMVSDREHPVDIDRLLVVTFTKAAAAQMRERITRALNRAVDENPRDSHLTRQLALIHNAQITTIDSFCLYLIRNHFDEINLDPDFRVADEGEIRLLGQDVLRDMLEEYFAAGDREFLDCVEYFAPAGSQKRLEEQILELYSFAMSYPWPLVWLEMHKKDYQVSPETLEEEEWVLLLREYVRLMIKEADSLLKQALKLCEEPDGPYMYADTLEAEREQLAGLARADSLQKLYDSFRQVSFGRISSKRDPSVSADKREQAKELRNAGKGIVTKLAGDYFQTPPDAAARRMAACAPYAVTLLSLTVDYCQRMEKRKREKNLLDFHDMEHLALSILIRPEDGKLVTTRTARELRESYAEIMIDEYQDSNLVQEYLMIALSGEETDRYNRFMVGDVKQSIYKFRLSRPELFMEKFDRYRKGEGEKERRIDLRKNFRSRRQVTDSVNDVFSRIMGRNLGGVAYDEDAALHPGARYEVPGQGEELYETELLLAVEGEDGLDEKEREAMLVADRIRRLAGSLPVTDPDTGQLRPARYKDMVILLRTAAGWDEIFRRVLEENGIPVHITSRTGYFAAPEVQNVLNFLRVLNNPLQDIPLFGVLRSPAAAFTDEEIARIRALDRTEAAGDAAPGGDSEPSGDPDGSGSRPRGKKLYHSLVRYAREGSDGALRKRTREFLSFLERFRGYVAYMPIHELVENFLRETGYLYTVSALPGGEQRRANVEMLLTRAENFEKTSYFGLFHFIRYMEQMEKYDIDYGEASLQDENADAVRIMSIHKSKGLEFPVCFLSGLSKSFNMKDTSKPVIMDMDYGIGLDYVDAENRVGMGTLKKSVLAGKLQRDNLGEELRVLYVAMTRAREKLIMTAGCKAQKAEKLQALFEEKGTRRRKSPDEAKLLPFSVRSSASCFLDWVLAAWADCQREAEFLTVSDFVSDRVEERKDRERLLMRLEKLAKGGADRETVPDGADGSDRSGERRRALKERMAESYPHENLSRLYTKTTVSELKKSGMEEAAAEAFHLFEEEEPVPYLPGFIRKEEEQAGRISGAARGSAYHRALELFPFGEWKERRGEEPSAFVRRQLDDMAHRGTLSGEFRSAVRPDRLATFLCSGLADRMTAAACEGKLFREQPFVLGLSASELDPGFPPEETLLIQGIIDVYFEENGELVVADYKTDAVTAPEELLNRYRVQLMYYARALEQLTGKRVKEKIIYSFALNKEIPVLP